MVDYALFCHAKAYLICQALLCLEHFVQICCMFLLLTLEFPQQILLESVCLDLPILYESHIIHVLLLQLCSALI